MRLAAVPPASLGTELPPLHHPGEPERNDSPHPLLPAAQPPVRAWDPGPGPPQHHGGLRTEGQTDPGAAGLQAAFSSGLSALSLPTICSLPQELRAKPVLEVGLVPGPLPGASLSGGSRSRVTDERGHVPLRPWGQASPSSSSPGAHARRAAAACAACAGCRACLLSSSSSWPPAPGAGASRAAGRPSPGPCAPSPRPPPAPSPSASPAPGHASC